ncbi:hypothetical protein COOONC_09019, partial [Cooperia oncophora]
FSRVFKALTSGVVPSLVSIFGNFFASENIEDSWVTYAASAGQRIMFFGDDTWIRLFPKSFAEAEGVTSFFVKDYTEVDKNVTRHLDSVLRDRNWDVLILHYLGLDHIGHSLGGRSPQIKEKLKEMDRIAQRIFDIVSAQSPLLLVAVGDHGMTNAGSHGGGSEAETKVPMVFLHSKASIKLAGSMDGFKSAEQVDLASTLPFFLRVPIPSDSIGVSLIPQLASHWQLNDSNVFSAALQSAIHYSKFADGKLLFFCLFTTGTILTLLCLPRAERGNGEERLSNRAKTFHRRMHIGPLAREDNRQAQRKIIQAQEQAFRWPIFVSLVLMRLGVSSCPLIGTASLAAV